MQIFNHPTFRDNRGSYTPISTSIMDMNWIQCSVSMNEKPFTFRGLHYQEINPQNKYVKVISGVIVDFMVDLETKKVDFEIVTENRAVFIPKTHAHGFLTLSSNTVVVYMIDDIYNPEFERSLVWKDIPEVYNVVMDYVPNENQLIISEKDKLGK